MNYASRTMRRRLLMGDTRLGKPSTTPCTTGLRARPLLPAEPVIALVLPIAAGVVVLHPHGGDIFGILEAELGGDANLDRETVGARQRLVIELERELPLRMQRRGHVDGVRIAFGALEPDVFRRR